MKPKDPVLNTQLPKILSHRIRLIRRYLRYRNTKQLALSPFSLYNLLSAMDNQINETSSLNAAGIEKEPPASITGGIEKGAGDSPTSSFIQNTVDKSSLASLNDRISQLQLPKSIHGKGESTGTDALHDESSSDEDDEIEPLCSYPYVTIQIYIYFAFSLINLTSNLLRMNTALICRDI